MAAVHLLGCLKEAFHTSGDPIFYLTHQFGEDILLGGGSMLPKFEFEAMTPGGILFPVPISTCIPMAPLYA